MSTSTMMLWSMLMIAVAVLPAVAVDQCGGDDDDDDDDDTGDDDDDATEGEFELITYNVAGLLDPISGSTPSVNNPLISPLLNAYDMALVQEDFYYHDELTSALLHPYQTDLSETWRFIRPGDGLNMFLYYSFDMFYREKWDACNGVVGNANDCLTDKGFSFGQVKLANGATVDVYNLHMDAGGADEDAAARADNVDQLAEFIVEMSAGRAVIVAGDTNLSYGREADRESLDRLLDVADLADACRYLACPEEAIDRVMFRPGDDVDLEATVWRRPTEFIDGAGKDLSDHRPVAVHFHWSKAPVSTP
ncbi:MAG: endonuclease [Deltaproteobacteria bacterium]|nr:endonuclease [bacterium]MCB9475773.1 endonuclease [Deltaproteobacteria bacterium]MCB9490325.1 endonuclease [Deltaproteobacteria bacterium]